MYCKSCWKSAFSNLYTSTPGSLPNWRLTHKWIRIHCTECGADPKHWYSIYTVQRVRLLLNVQQDPDKVHNGTEIRNYEPYTFIVFFLIFVWNVNIVSRWYPAGANSLKQEISGLWGWGTIVPLICRLVQKRRKSPVVKAWQYLCKCVSKTVSATLEFKEK